MHKSCILHSAKLGTVRGVSGFLGGTRRAIVLGMSIDFGKPWGKVARFELNEGVTL